MLLARSSLNDADQQRPSAMRLRWTRSPEATYPAISLAAAATAGLLILICSAGLGSSWNWTSLLLVAVNLVLWSVPLVVQLMKKQLDPFHPLCYAALFFGLPMVVVRGLVLALSNDPAMLDISGDTVFYLDMALAWTAVGWGFVLCGYYLPISAQLGRKVTLLPRSLTSRHLESVSRLVPILAAGVLINLLLLWEGSFGSSLSEFIGNLTFVSVFRAMNHWFFMGWFLVVFFAVRAGFRSAPLALLLVSGTLAVAQGLLSGSRGYVFTCMIVAAAAAFYAGPGRIRSKWVVAFFGAAIAALFLGFLLMSQYRVLRQQQYGIEPISIKETSALVRAAIEDSSRMGLEEQAAAASARMLERLNSLDLLGITLARSEVLKPAERSVGIDNNILKDIMLGFIPRPLWPDKPTTGDFGLWFSRLYLDSPYLTWSGPSVFGDLYRNFGYAGIPAGMLLIGIYLRTIYGALVGGGAGTPMGPLLYVFLLQSLNWEGAYSSFITAGSRDAFTFVVLTLVLLASRGLVPRSNGLRAEAATGSR
jgi:hypothetical protein